MVKYRIPQSDLDEVNKERVLSIIRFYTIKEGGVDINKINQVTLLSRFSISLDDAKRLLQELIVEGKVEKVG